MARRERVAAAAGGHTLIPVVSAACTSCRVLRDSATGGIRVTLGAAQRTAPGSAFALLDFGGLGGAGGVVRVHDRIGLDRGDVPQSDLSVLQVTDIENRVAYRLQIDRLTRVLRLVSPPGGLSRSGLDVSTGTQVPDDGVRSLTVDIAAQAGRSLVVQVNGRTVVSNQRLSGGDALRQRYLAVGILNTPASMTTLSVNHDALQVNVGSAAGGDQSGVSAAGIALSPVVTLVPPANLTPPTIAGDDVAGQPLTATPGTWSDAGGLRIRWSRCAGDGSGCQQIADASGTSYTPDSSDAGSTFLVTVTATNNAGNGVATSSLTPVVANFKPVLMSAPSIAGDTTEGSTLTASPGTWAWRNGTFTYAWQRCDATGANCATIAGATAATLALGSDDVGSTIRLLLTVPGLTDTTTVTTRATDVVQRAAPVNLSAPVVTGNAVTGAVLTAAPGTWSDPSASFIYAWDRCSGDGSCLPIAGANGNTYRVGVEDLGSLLRVTVSATNARGVGSASSTPGGATTSGAPTLSAAPSITGDTNIRLDADPEHRNVERLAGHAQHRLAALRRRRHRLHRHRRRNRDDLHTHAGRHRFHDRGRRHCDERRRLHHRHLDGHGDDHRRTGPAGTAGTHDAGRTRELGRAVDLRRHHLGLHIDREHRNVERPAGHARHRLAALRGRRHRLHRHRRRNREHLHARRRRRGLDDRGRRHGDERRRLRHRSLEPDGRHHRARRYTDSDGVDVNGFKLP